MSRDHESVPWPAEAGDPRRLPTEMEPPADLEQAVVSALHERSLLRLRTDRRFRWSSLRVAVLAAACIAAGFGVGRLAVPEDPAAAMLEGSATDVWAVLLYENEGYDRPGPDEMGVRYGEYGHWVAEALRRQQFLTGQDLVAEEGWLLLPGEGDEPRVERSATVGEAGAPLSGVFFLRADDPRQVLSLARELPHLRHGGAVVVQKTVPTASPPADP